MLTKRGTEILKQMTFNMRVIEEHYQPVNGMDSDERKTIRVMAQAIAFLLTLVAQADSKILVAQTDGKIKENEAAEREVYKELEEMFPLMFKKNDKAS